MRLRTFLAVVAIAAMLFVGWCTASYLRLERLELAVADARARLQAAERRRIDLSRNLVRDTEGLECMTENDRARLLSAAAALEQSMLRPESLSSDPESYRRFLDASSRLERGLLSVWPALDGSRSESAGWLLESIKPSVESATQAAELRLDGFKDALDAYGEERGRFPGSFVSTIGRADPFEGSGVVRAGDGRR